MTRALLTLVLLAACSHDSARENPLDPELTPPVSVRAQLDSSGTVHLTWSRYTGTQSFSAYQVVRRVAESVRQETLSVLTSVADTVFTDTTIQANTAYSYRVDVANTSGFHVPSAEVGVDGFAVEAAQLLAVELDRSSGSYRLRWQRYRGARFSGYRIERRSADELDFVSLGVQPAAVDTSFVDSTSVSEATYVYRIVTVAAEREWISIPSGQVGFSLQAPVLTIATVEQDGVFQLSWSRYEGPRFGAYHILRQDVHAGVVDSLAAIATVADTTWVDASARHDVSYIYSISVDADGQTLASNGRAERLRLPSVPLATPIVDVGEASVELNWETYEGPHFGAYAVQRSTGGPFETVKTFTDIGATRWADTSGLTGNTEYTFRIAVETSRGELVLGDGRPVLLYELVDIWPMPVTVGPNDHIRLYYEDGGITALVAGVRRIHLVRFATDGALLEERELLDMMRQDVVPSTVASALDSEGRRYLSINGRIHLIDTDGQFVAEEQALFVDTPLPGSLASDAPTTGDITLTLASRGFSSGRAASFDNVTLLDAAGIVYEDAFDTDTASDWPSTSDVEFEGGRVLMLESPLVERSNNGPMRAARTDSTRGQFVVEADIVPGLSRAGLTLGVPGTGSLFLDLVVGRLRDPSFDVIGAVRPSLGRIRLIRTWTEESLRRSDTISESFPLLPGRSYGVRLGIVQGQLEAAIRYPVTVAETADPDNARWSSVATLPGDNLNRLLYSFNEAAGGMLSEQDLGNVTSGSVSEWRLWQGSRGRSMSGICIPSLHAVFLQPTSQGFLPAEIIPFGGQIGGRPGDLLFPLSFDVGPDVDDPSGQRSGNIFVLDAGNDRIQVYNTARQYVTQWGRPGSAPGEFDFGRGARPEQFAGSIAIDDDGFIYVADVGNKRIQKFAP